MGLTLDSGALIAIERRDRRASAWLAEAVDRGTPPNVSAVVVAEVWRGGRRSALLARALRLCRIIPADEAVARAAGELLAAAGSDATIDALVVTAAAIAGDAVLTSDPHDLAPLGARVGVTVLGL